MNAVFLISQAKDEQIVFGPTSAFDELVEQVRARVREEHRRLAPVPPDVQEIIDNTPKDQIPMIPYREDTPLFMDHAISETDCQRGWISGKIGQRTVCVSLPPWEDFLKRFGAQLGKELDRSSSSGSE